MGTMKVAVIAAEMEGRATGVGRYLEGLLHGLERWTHGVEWHLFFQGDPWSSLSLPDGPFHAHFSRHNGSRVLWEQVLVSRAVVELEPDVVFGPAYTLPFGLRAPSVVTVHDLSFEILPREFSLRERWRRRLLARRAVRAANRVLAVSEHMAELVTQRYGLAEGHVSVVPHGVDSARFSPTRQDADGRVLAELGVRHPYILWAGTVLERRLPRQVLKAFAVVKREHPELELVIAGANRMRQPDKLDVWIDEFGLGEAVRELGWVEEAVLAPLYRCAEFAVYVSRHEGFGLPPVECLACGTPVVVSTGLGLDDAWPDYPYRVDELGTAGIAAVMTEILENADRAARVMADAETVTVGFDWETSSRRLVAELGRVLSP
jgi:glycosyltransferase involved in cell wall biosynthesis